MTEPVVLPASARWTIPGESATAGLRISLAMPMTRSKEPVRALLVLDGDSLFHTATEFVRTVHHVTMGHFPRVAVIGVVRDEPHGMQYVASRFRDFTPQQWTLTGPFADDNAMVTMGTGGASEFLASIEDETDRLTSIVTNLLDLGRLESGMLRPTLGAHSVEEVVPTPYTFPPKVFHSPPHSPNAMVQPWSAASLYANLFERKRLSFEAV